MRLSAVYRMSEDGVYLSSNPSFLGDVEFEGARFRFNFGFRGGPLKIWLYMVWSKCSKIGLQEFRINLDVQG